SAEGTLPETLSSAQVWVGPDGQLQLLDIPLLAPDAEEASGPRRALALLAEVAALVLEGRPRPVGQSSPAGVPISLHARPSIDRLLGAGKPYRDVTEFHTAVQALADESAEVTSQRRGTHLTIQAAFLFLGMGCCMLPAGWFNQFLPFLDLSV